MKNIIIDHYTLEAEIQDESATIPVRCIATNTDDESTAETWLTFQKTVALLEFVYGEHAASQMKILRSHGYLDFVSHVLQQGATSRCIVNQQT